MTLTEQLEWLQNSGFQIKMSILPASTPDKRWGVSLGDKYVFGSSLPCCVNEVYAQAINIALPCVTCFAMTEHGDEMSNGECENCSNTRRTGKAYFSLGLVRSNQELQRTASILEMNNQPTCN